jgi:hypothetical protein
MRAPLRAAAAAVLLAAAPTIAHAAPAMWEVSDGDSKVWLFGSMHEVLPDTSWRTPLLDEKLKAAETVYFEADVGPLGMLGILIWGVKTAFATQQNPWLPTLTPEQTAQLTAAVTPLGMTLQQVGMYEPWLASAMISQKATTSDGGKLVMGPDAVLENELPKERKAYFETAVGQMKMMSSLPRQQQITSLFASLSDLGKQTSEFATMAGQWASGDIDALGAALKADPTMDQTFEQTMLFDRDAAWATTIEGLLRDNHNDLVVVGAAHLIGDKSVIDLLGKAGFTVQRIQ